MTWLSGLSDVALAYGLPEAEIEQRMYTFAEQLHQHYCLQRGIVNHNEARPDQHVALSMMAALAATDWFLARGDERLATSWMHVPDYNLNPPEGIETSDTPDS